MALGALTGCFYPEEPFPKDLSPGDITGVLVGVRPGTVGVEALSGGRARLLRSARVSSARDDGRFYLRNLPAGPHALRFFYDENRDGVPDLAENLDVTVRVRGGERARVDLGRVELLKPAVVRGRVTGGGSTPADVFLVDEDVRVTTAADGSFEIRGLGRGTWKVLAWGGGLRSAVKETTVTPGQEVDVGVLELVPLPPGTGSIDVWLNYPEGTTPFAGAGAVTQGALADGIRLSTPGAVVLPPGVSATQNGFQLTGLPLDLYALDVLLDDGFLPLRHAFVLAAPDAPPVTLTVLPNTGVGRCNGSLDLDEDGLCELLAEDMEPCRAQCGASAACQVRGTTRDCDDDSDGESDAREALGCCSGRVGCLQNPFLGDANGNGVCDLEEGRGGPGTSSSSSSSSSSSGGSSTSTSASSSTAGGSTSTGASSSSSGGVTSSRGAVSSSVGGTTSSSGGVASSVAGLSSSDPGSSGVTSSSQGASSVGVSSVGASSVGGSSGPGSSSVDNSSSMASSGVASSTDGSGDGGVSVGGNSSSDPGSSSLDSTDAGASSSGDSGSSSGGPKLGFGAGATNLANPTTLAYHAALNTLYWLDSSVGEIQRCDLSSDCPVRDMVMLVADTHAIAIGGDQLFVSYTDYSGMYPQQVIWACTLPDCNNPATVVIDADTGLAAFTRLAYAGGDLYWLAASNDGDTSIYACRHAAAGTLGNDCAMPMSLGSLGYVGGESITASGSDVLVATSSGGTGTILGCPLGNNCLSPVTVAQFLSFDVTSVQPFNSGNSLVYAASSPTNTIFRCNRGDCAATQVTLVASPDGPAEDLLVVGSTAYYSVGGGAGRGLIQRVTLP